MNVEADLPRARVLGAGFRVQGFGYRVLGSGVVDNWPVCGRCCIDNRGRVTGLRHLGKHWQSGVPELQYTLHDKVSRRLDQLLSSQTIQVNPARRLLIVTPPQWHSPQGNARLRRGSNSWRGGATRRALGERECMCVCMCVCARVEHAFEYRWRRGPNPRGRVYTGSR